MALKSIYFQACEFKANKEDKWQPGIAQLAVYGVSDVEFIIDVQGKRYPDVFDYALLDGERTRIELHQEVPAGDIAQWASNQLERANDA